jgi:hypothetical protein
MPFGLQIPPDALVFAGLVAFGVLYVRGVLYLRGSRT